MKYIRAARSPNFASARRRSSHLGEGGGDVLRAAPYDAARTAPAGSRPTARPSAAASSRWPASVSSQRKASRSTRPSSQPVRRDPLWHSSGPSASFRIGTLPVSVPALVPTYDPRDGVHHTGSKLRNQRQCGKWRLIRSVGQHQAPRGPDRRPAPGRRADHGFRPGHPGHRQGEAPGGRGHRHRSRSDSTTTATTASRWTSPSATRSSTASTAAPRSSTPARSTSSSPPATCSPSFPDLDSRIRPGRVAQLVELLADRARPTWTTRPFLRKEHPNAQDPGVRRERPPLARARRRQARQRRQGDARPAWPLRRAGQEVGRPHDHQRRCHRRA